MKRLFAFLAVLFFAFSSFAAKVDTIAVQSTLMKKKIRCIFITPNQTIDTEHFPVVYVLHGYSGNAIRTIEQDIPDLAAQADIYKMIFVLADGGFDSWYFDSPVNDQLRYESFISKELISFTDRNYPTIMQREKRAIYGWSMGGHGALFIAMRHKDLYGAAGSICGAVDFRPFVHAYGIEKSLGDFSSHERSWETHTVSYTASSLKNKELKLIIDCGLNDPLLEINRSLHRKLTELKIEHDYTERPGAHDAAYWSKASAFQLLFIHHYFMQS
ncbi:prolyl oligopeptidase family serine peptidase [Pedobacter sp. PAMC26386]|nr:prolyl oligopeptidase family serine peptidase [Pedobacter sp. PAMC26386]